jgi:hypothetical protein
MRTDSNQATKPGNEKFKFKNVKTMAKNLQGWVRGNVRRQTVPNFSNLDRKRTSTSSGTQVPGTSRRDMWADGSPQRPETSGICGHCRQIGASVT